MTSVRRKPRLLGILLAVGVAATSMAVLTPTAMATQPTATVSLGDNGISGEGAGSYEAGTNGENGNYCHRSTNALVHRIGLSDHSFNLACSGARSEHVWRGGASLYNEGPQAERLAHLASQYMVTTIILRVGSNDDPQFSPTVAGCIAAHLDTSRPDCSTQLRSVWQARLDAMAVKVNRAVTDVQAVMRESGYTTEEYRIVLTSYASPITELMTPSAEIGGCPFRLADARWARTEAVPALNTTLRQIALQAGVRYLDLGHATDNREACSGGDDPSSEWQTRIKVDPYKLVSGQLSAEEKVKAAESFHLNAAAHGQLARCTKEFLQSNSDEGWCEEGPDGNLHAVIPGP
jgi:GDSL-like Lipase/Acylhydrolase family